VYESRLIDCIAKVNDAAFVWDDRLAWLHIKRSEATAANGELPAMRLASQPLCNFISLSPQIHEKISIVAISLDCGFSMSRLSTHSPYKHVVDRLNHRLFEHGIRMQQWKMSYQYMKNRYSYDKKNRDGRLDALSLYRVYGFFELLIIGELCSGVVLLLEILWKRVVMLQKRREHRVNKKVQPRIEQKTDAIHSIPK